MFIVDPTSLLVKSEMISDPIKISNKFNEYFSTIVSQLQGKIYYYGQDYSKYFKNYNEYTFFITPNDNHEIIKVINNLNTNKVTGPHSIPTPTSYI